MNFCFTRFSNEATLNNSKHSEHATPIKDVSVDHAVQIDRRARFNI